jgi:hypothetical protein
LKTIEHKREKLRQHYLQAYKVTLNPALPDEKIEELYTELLKLHWCEQRHKDQYKLKLVPAFKEELESEQIP